MIAQSFVFSFCLNICVGIEWVKERNRIFSPVDHVCEGKRLDTFVKMGFPCKTNEACAVSHRFVSLTSSETRCL